jgi:RHS repeat-associated protein
VHRVSAEGKQRYEHRYTQFDPNGHVQEEQLIHSLGQVITAHDLLERPSRQSSSLMDQSISYGPSGLVDQIHNSIFGTKDYLYDPLNQITQESNQRYSFNSFGNPIGCEVNDCNQILSTSDSKLNYDPDGNPIQRIKEGDCTSYRYDALGRLVEIRTTQKKVHYSYDPLSRLISKETFNLQSGKWSRQKILYLYDQEKEIGTCTIHHDILELKVLGLGIKGDIGGAIAIEIGQEVYVPFHDFNGHVILLISSEGKVVEKNLIDAFGKQTTDPSSKNPWRFCSKRCEEDLIFFGKRFYDPSLGRWLTPDPAGFTEGPNLYVYVLNNPINRLDLFGLRSDPIYPWTNGQGEPNIEVEISRIPTAANVKEVLVCKGAVGDVEVDWIVSCSNWHKLQFTPEELNAGKINIIDHFYEIMPKDGMIIGLITAQNGIMTNLGELKVMGDSIIDKIPESSLFIGMHNPTLGFVSDLRRVRAEKKGVDTPIVCRTRQFMEAIVDRVHNLNPNLLWMHISHSEGGLIAYRALEGMTPEHKEQLKEHLLSVSLGPAHPIPKSLAKGAVNYYSNKDYITKWFGEPFINDKDYDIRVVECVSSRDEMNGGIADHKFHGSTYQRSLNIEVSDSRIKYGFYDEQKR